MTDVLPSRDDSQLFRRARRLGFAGVEVNLQPNRPERIDAVRRAQAETGLAVPSLVLGEHNDLGGIADDDSAVAASAADDVRRAIEWAAELGADALLVPFFGRAELRDEGDLRRAAAAFRPLCQTAGERGVSLLYEGTLAADEVRRLAGLVDSGAFGCYFDYANVVARGMDSATELRLLAELVRRVHLKDVRVTVNDCPPGLGLVDFGESGRALDAIGYDGWVVLETPPGPPELVARDLSFARAVVPGLEVDVSWPRLGVFARELPSWEGVIERCLQLGLGAVQLGGQLLEECFEQPERAAALEEAGIAVAAIAGYRNLVAPDEAERKANVEFLARCLEVAPLIGTAVVATETGTRSRTGEWTASPENRSPETLALLDESLASLLEVAESHGAILAVEGSIKHAIGTHAALEGVLERFPTRGLQVVLDPYNYLSRHLLPVQERVTRAFLDRFEHRFVLAHVKDVGPGGAEEATPEVGTGVFVQQPYLAFLEERRPDLPLILEHLPLANVPRASARVRVASAGARRARRSGDLLPRPPPVSALAQDRVVAGVPVRVFAPGAVDGIYLHLHGGGFVYGSARLQDDRLERLALESRTAVISVEYRLAPEHPYPAAASDCEAVAVWLAEAAVPEFGTDRIAIGGESAGANLAVVTLLRLRDRGDSTGFRAAVLCAGSYDLELTTFEETSDTSVTRDELELLSSQYSGSAERRDPTVSPVHADLSGMPEALFVVGSLDPLLRDSLRMAERWRAAGSGARVTVIPGGLHGVDASPELHRFLTDTLGSS
jgi:acetyl esterase